MWFCLQMDPHCGNEEEAMDCILEIAEQLPTSQCASPEDLAPKPNVIADDESLTERKVDATLPICADAITHCSELTSDEDLETIHHSKGAVVGENVDATNQEIAYDSPGSSALNECNETTLGKGIGNAPDFHGDSAMSIPTGTATNAKFDIVNNDGTGIKVKPVVNKIHDASCSGNVVAASDINVAMKSCTSSNDAVIGRITVLSIDEEKTAAGKLNTGTERIDHAMIACSDPASNRGTNVTFSDCIPKYEERGGLHEMKDMLPLNCEMGLHSGKSVQPSNKRDSDSHYDSEIEIIDCTSESCDGQPVSRGATPSNPSSVVEESSLDNISGIVNMSGSGIVQARNKIPRNKKREKHQVQCENLRRFRLRMKSGDIIQPSQSRSRISSHSLEKLTKTNLKFMENFDPKMSNRERRKMMIKTTTRRHLRGDVYGANGELMSCGKNLCDCMNADCPGCHFPCPRCQSAKCGHECRVNRKWTYEEIEIDGTDIVIRPHEIIESFFNDSQ